MPLRSLIIDVWLGVTPIPAPILPPLNNFRNLKVLCIENLPLQSIHVGPGPSWPEVLTGLLRGSPQLEYLRLSACVGRHYTPTIRDLLMNFCIYYGRSGGAPLSLKVLNLGDGMMLRPQFYTPQGILPTYLARLTKFELLEEIHLPNVICAKYFSVPLAYALIHHAVTPRLRRLYLPIMDAYAYFWLTAAYAHPRATEWISRMQVHVEHTGWFPWFVPAPLPDGKHPALGLDPADMFSSSVSPLRPARLSLGHMEVGSSHVPMFARPWGHLRSLSVTISGRQVAGFGLMCEQCTGSLESLLVQVVVDDPARTVGETREEVGVLVGRIARQNLNLDYVKFMCFGRYWNEASVCTWKRRGAEPMHSRMEEARVLHRSPDVDDEEEEPQEFWDESRKVLKVAGVDLLRR